MLAAHGILFPLLFFLAGVLVDRAGETDLSRMGGLGDAMPIFRGFWAIALFALMGVPVFCEFAGQFLVVTGAFQSASQPGGLAAVGQAPVSRLYVLAILACLGTVLMGCQGAMTLRRLLFGALRIGRDALVDVDYRELAVIIPLAALALLLGVLPGLFFFDFTQSTVQAMSQYGKVAPWPLFRSPSLTH